MPFVFIWLEAAPWFIRAIVFLSLLPILVTADIIRFAWRLGLIHFFFGCALTFVFTTWWIALVNGVPTAQVDPSLASSHFRIYAPHPNALPHSLSYRSIALFVGSPTIEFAKQICGWVGCVLTNTASLCTVIASFFESFASWI
jgi:hypothetical protein